MRRRKAPPLSQDDLERVSRLHRIGPGEYRVGASPLRIVRHAPDDWAIYADALEGSVRIRGRWNFKKLKDARRRAFEVAKERGWA